MEYDEMIVTMEDGTTFTFFKKDDTLTFFLCDGESFYNNEVEKDTIHAVVGEPLSFTYYYGNGNSDDMKTKNMVKKIGYK